MSGREEAGAAVQRALAECMGPGAAEQLALAQVRLAWSEVLADAGLERGPLTSRVRRVTGGTAHVEASDPMLAQELTLRAEALVWAVNDRMRGRPGATIELRRTGRIGGSRNRVGRSYNRLPAGTTTRNPGPRMSNRFATRIGLPSAEERPADAHDVVAFHEPAVGAQARTKGSLFLLAQLTGGSPSSPRPRARRSTRSSATTTTTSPPACSSPWPRRWLAPTAASTTSAGGWESRAVPA